MALQAFPGTGIARLPTRFYQPFLFTFAEQPQKNMPVDDDAVAQRFDDVRLQRTAPTMVTQERVAASEQERALLVDIARVPIAGITARYDRLGWHPMTGNAVKNSIIAKGPFDGRRRVPPQGEVLQTCAAPKALKHEF
jgi:hypothetical protein